MIGFEFLDHVPSYGKRVRTSDLDSLFSGYFEVMVTLDFLDSIPFYEVLFIAVNLLALVTLDNQMAISADPFAAVVLDANSVNPSRRE